MSPETLLGRSIESVLGAQQFETFRSQVLDSGPPSPKLLSVPVNGLVTDMYCTFHRHDGVLIVELDLVHGTIRLNPSTWMRTSEFHCDAWSERLTRRNCFG
jgi:hypothetical protein